MTVDGDLLDHSHKPYSATPEIGGNAKTRRRSPCRSCQGGRLAEKKVLICMIHSLFYIGAWVPDKQARFDWLMGLELQNRSSHSDGLDFQRIISAIIRWTFTVTVKWGGGYERNGQTSNVEGIYGRCGTTIFTMYVKSKTVQNRRPPVQTDCDL